MFSYFNYISIKLRDVISEEIIFIALILLGIGSFVLFFSIYIFIYMMNREEEFRLKYRLSEAFSEQQKEYFEELTKKELCNRKLIHDWKSELIVLNAYVRNKRYFDAEEYLLQMGKSIESIENSDYHVGNDIIDVILNYYLKQLDKNISISVRGMVASNINIGKLDLCIIISNIVKNAVEELAMIDSAGFFEFEIWQNEDLLIKEKNSCRMDNGDARKKQGRHYGLGMTNVSEALSKYDGTFTHSFKEGVFECIVIIPQISE